ncbi:MAG: hypothetical protein RL653_3466 [Pseudomonadota bacterium]
MIAAALAAWLAASTSPARAVQDHFERAGRRPPAASPALERAAAALADLALDHPAAEITAHATLVAAVSEAGGWDPSPRAFVFRSRPAEAALRALAERGEVASEPATHVGVATAASGELGTLVVLLAQRYAELATFPRRLPEPVPSQHLCGRLLGDRTSPELYVTGPNGKVLRKTIQARGEHFCVDVPLNARGRHTVEVMARTRQSGPEVVSLFLVDVGDTTARSPVAVLPEPASDREAVAAIHSRVSGFRAAHGLAGLKEDPALSRVAQAYAERMAAGHFFAHVAPEGDDIRKRLADAGYAYEAAGENLGSAPGALAAHFGIEHSPGHRKLLLDRPHTVLGVGLAWEELGPGQRQAVVVELLARPARAAADPVAAAYSALNERRAALGLPALERSEVLEQMARAHARAALAARRPAARLEGTRPLAERVLEATQHQAAAVDVVVANSPLQASAATHVSDTGARLAGIGLVRDGSEWWIVVITAEPARR